MTLHDFIHAYVKYGAKDRIPYNCENPACPHNPMKPSKTRVQQSLISKGRYFCRPCAISAAYAENPMTDEWKEKISKSRTGQTRSEETKKKMSDAKLAYWNTPEGEANKIRLAQLASKQHESHMPELSRRRGVYASERFKKTFAFSSSYELRAILILENDYTVSDIDMHLGFEVNGRNRNLDFLVTYKDDPKKRVIEIKPESMVSKGRAIQQIADTADYCVDHGYHFSVWTEKELGFDAPKDATRWADEFMSTLGPIDFVEARTEANRAKANRHYDSKLSERITVYCEHCKEEHMMRKAQHDRNVEKNGRYICIKENGKIIGERSKDYLKKENPYAAEGKKQCLGVCGQILDLDCFGNDKSRVDGKADRCKACRASAATAKYQAKKS